MNKIKQYFICRNYRTKDCDNLYEKDCPATCAYSRRILNEAQNIPKEVSLENFVFDDLWGNNNDK